MLADKIRHYQEEKKMLKNTPAGYKKEYPWLKEVDSLALANVQLNLEGAFRKFFREPGVAVSYTHLKGYPDGLKGEEIPISAQVVSLADVYDALVSDRVYKKAYSHEKAMEMILKGECGMFNPLLLECLVEIQDKVRKELDIKDVNECLEYLEERNR